uniref:Uncharacterized protein n=1 Tax=Arundo donax TaxID=35708 RepID=A0A0A9E8D9_ARUDO
MICQLYQYNNVFEILQHNFSPHIHNVWHTCTKAKCERITMATDLPML